MQLLFQKVGVTLFSLFFVLQSRWNTNVDMIYQYPSFPTGCESVSTVMLLNHLGYDITPEEFIDTYLPQCKEANMYNTIFDDYFVGNPRSNTGWMCYVKPLAIAVSSYFSEVNEWERRCYDLTGFDFEFVCNEVIKGNPAVIWVTIGYVDAREEKRSWGTIQRPSHTVLLTGIDLSRRVVFINDPIDGKIEVDFDKVKSLYNARGKRGLIIK